MWSQIFPYLLTPPPTPPGVDTPFSVIYGSKKNPIINYTDIRNLPTGTYTFVDGDGTVPAMSARADGLDATERVTFIGEHKGLLDLPEVWEKLQEWLNEGREEEAARKEREKARAVEVGEDGGWVVIGRGDWGGRVVVVVVVVV